MTDFKQYKDIVYRIIGSAMIVHNELGGGLLEAIYNEALHLEFSDRGIEHEVEKHLACYYKNHKMEKYYQMDMVVGDVIVELKSVNGITPAHRAQLFNYMRITHQPIGLLINFGLDSLEGERYAYIEETNQCFMLDRNMNLLYEDAIYE